LYSFPAAVASFFPVRGLPDCLCRQRLEDFLQAQGIVFHPAYLQQPHALYSLLPTGTDRLRTWRNMTADAMGHMFPFTKKVYYDPGGWHYGIHKYNGTWVVLNPFASSMDNASEIVLGRPGRGKSAYFKQQIDLLVTLGHRVFVVDIEGEYRTLCDDMHGVYLEFSRTAENHLNILDLNPLASDPFGAGLSMLTGFLTMALDRDLAPVERNVVVPRYYEEVMRHAGISIDDSDTWQRNAPRLSDLRRVLEQADESASRELAQLLYIYTEGMYGDVFDRRSNVDLSQAPLIVFGLRDVANELAGLYLWLITNLVWTAVSAAGAAQPVHLFVDEGWHLLQHSGTAAELGGMARRFRKYYSAIHLATQFGQDLARSPDAEVIRDAVGIVTLFGQNPRAAQELGDLFSLAPHEVAELVQLAKGEALLLWNQETHIPVYVPLPPDRADLYKTDPAQQRAAARVRRGVEPMVVE
jgi:type IV secretory pathway VirB4 component